jgi:diguanylate cyclase (GGDEF)-like protein
LSIAYPVGDMVLLVALGSVLLRGGFEGTRRSLHLIELGLIALVAADLVYGYISLHGTYRGGDPVDGLWLLGLALFAAAPTFQRDPRAPDTRRRDTAAPARRAHLTWLPYAAVATGFTMLAISNGSQRFFPEQTLAFVAIVLAALVATRQLLAQRRLLAVQEQLQEAHDRLEAMSITDLLTGLPNHGAIVDVIDRELARSRRHARSFALLFIDLDHFKLLNDTFGHLAGDDALRGLGRVLRECLRTIDTVGRWGGEEFVAVLPESDGIDAFVTAELIRSVVAGHGSDGEGLGTTCSIGVASYPEDATNRSKLLELADAAMYAAKARGRNRTIAAGDAYARRSRFRFSGIAGPATRASRQLVQRRGKPAA